MTCLALALRLPVPQLFATSNMSLFKNRANVARMRDTMPLPGVDGNLPLSANNTKSYLV